MNHVKQIRSPDNWKSSRPYAAAVAAGDMVFLAGHVPVDGSGGSVTGDSRAKSAAVLANLDRTLATAGLGRDSIVATTVYLTDMADIDGLDDAFRDYFGPDGPFPSRTTVEVSSLGRPEFSVEISAIAVSTAASPEDG